MDDKRVALTDIWNAQKYYASAQFIFEIYPFAKLCPADTEHYGAFCFLRIFDVSFHCHFEFVFWLEVHMWLNVLESCLHISSHIMSIKPLNSFETGKRRYDDQNSVWNALNCLDK